MVETLALKLGVLIKKDKGEHLVERQRGAEGEGPDIARFPGMMSREVAEEDDPWSDSDDDGGERGGELPEDLHLPQHHGDNASDAIERRRRRRRRKISTSRPSNVPKLAINPKRDEGSAISTEAEAADDESCMHIEKHIKGKGWRRLERAKVGTNFYKKIVNPQPLQTKESFVNSLNKYRLATMVDPAKAVDSSNVDFQSLHRFESLFIRDVLGDGLRVVEQTRARKEREEELLAGGGLDEIVANQPNELTLADKHATKAPNLEDEEDEGILAHKAIECCRAGNITDLEFILDRNIIDVNTKDENGNSLLHLCCQQGNKRMVKFMLRRGADIKTQNAAGNSVLHHCHLYSHTDLAAYLLSKGADDSLINAEGCTCYEGLSKDAVAEI